MSDPAVAERGKRIGAAIVITVLAATGFVIASGPARAACGFEHLSVTGTAEEEADACRAARDVLAWFEDLGFAVEPSFRVVFADRVVIDMFDAAGGDLTGTAEVSGYFDARRDEVRVTSGRRDLRRSRRPWGIEWGRPIAYSILQHELVHAVTADLLGDDYSRSGHAFHEYVAYVIQFDLMEADLRARILAAHPEFEPFPGREAINGLVHAANPEAFGLRSHLFAKTPDGRLLLGQILGREIGLADPTEIYWTP
jgi:hypothetical protein